MTKHNRKKNQTRKKRVPIVGLDFGKSVEISYISFENNRLIFKDEQENVLNPKFVSVGDAYLRKLKPKIVRQLPANPTNIILNTKHLLNSHDMTLVVDTNRQNFEGFSLCVSSSTVVMYEIEDERRTGYCYPQADFLFYTSSQDNPERFGWWDILNRFIHSTFYNEKSNYGLVVDSDLRELPKINSGQVPLWKRHYLPDGFQIMYASADVGRESYINQEIKLCDKRAKKTLLKILPSVDVNKIRSSLKDTDYFPICYLKDKVES